MATVKFPQEMDASPTIAGDDKLMIAKATTGEAMQATFDSAKQYLNITGIEVKAVAGGETEDTAVVLSPGPDGQVRKMSSVTGWFKNATGPAWLAPETNDNTNWWDGTTWSLGSSVPLPMQQGVDVIDPTGEALPKEKAVADYSLEKVSPRALPFDYSFLTNDRPDMGDGEIIIIDKNGYFLPSPYVPFSSKQILPGGFSYYNGDRPDWVNQGIIILDKNGLYIPIDVQTKDDEFTYSWYGGSSWFPVESVKDLDYYYGQWDELIEYNPNYVSKTALQNSGGLNLPIWRYDFKPDNPKIKVMLVGCTHGWEKNFSFALRLFMKQLVDVNNQSEEIMFLRQNVHFIVVPVVSPDPFILNPFTENPAVRDRAGFETPLFPASWTKSGNVITVTFNESDFPVNPRTSASDYFTNRPSIELVGKVGITITESSNTTEFPDNVYEIKSIVDARTVTINTPTSGTGSGSMKMCVKSDVNRNSNTSSWGTNGHSSNTVGNPQTYYDNKGTRPFSLQETCNIRDILLANTDISFYYDFHSGAGDYVTYIAYPPNNKDNSFETLKTMVQRKLGVTPNYYTDTNSSLYRYACEQLNIVGANPEWKDSTPPVTGFMNDVQATEIHQWIGNMLYVSSKINIELKNL